VTLISFLEDDYAHTLQKIADLTNNGEITFDLLWAIFLPQTLLFTLCPTTSEPRAFRLGACKQQAGWLGQPHWELECEYADERDGSNHEFGLVTTLFSIQHFKGVKKISDLSVYPLESHPTYKDVKQKLLDRGRRRLNLAGVSHMHYSGVGYLNSEKFKVSL
jgi:hypothetical protein